MAQFYTLEEAARALGMDPEELKQKAQRREVRAFLDSGSWRFRVSDIDELARRSGMGSDPDLSLSDLDLPSQHAHPSGFETSDEDSDLSEFQLGVARSDLGPASMEVPSSDSTSDDDILLDDTSLPRGGGSSSHIIGMEAQGKQPSDSDVRLVPDEPKGASDSDVQLSGEIDAIPPSASDSDVTLVKEDEASVDAFDSFSTLEQDESAELASSAEEHAGTDTSGETMLRPSPLGSSGEVKAEPEGISSEAEEDSDFELTPSSVIDALQPDSGSDFELTALDGSDEFEAEAPKPSDSDVTGAEPASSGVNLDRPSDSGINLQSMGELESNDSIELMPVEDQEGQRPQQKPKPKPAAAEQDRPDPSATALPTKSPDPSATALPTRDLGQKDIFEDTDFEVDALDSGEDQTIHLEAASDFDLDEGESDSASEVFPLDEEDVDQNAATAMGPAVLEEDDALGAAFAEVDEEGASDEMASAGWGEEAEDEAAPAAAPRQRAAGAGTSVLSAQPGAEWGGLWVGVLGVTTVLMMALAFITMDVVRNLNAYQGDTPVASGLVTMITGSE